MTSAPCTAATTTEMLVAYLLRELDGVEEAELEEHLFGCVACSTRLQELVHVSEGIRHAARSGTLFTVVSAPFIDRLRGTGLRIRKYDLQPGGSVLCTATADDDLVVAYLHAPLENVTRLDLLVHDSVRNARWRLVDIGFNAEASEVVIAPSVVELRRSPKTTQTMQLMAVAGGAEREIAKYTFNHTPT